MLENTGGLLKISNFLPTWVADGALEMIEGIKDWNKTEADHELWSVKKHALL